MAAFQASVFVDIRLSDDDRQLMLEAELAAGGTIAVSMPIEQFGKGVPEILRCLEAARQRKDSGASGYRQIEFSRVRQIETKPDATKHRVYLILDPGKINQIAFAIPAVEALRIALEISDHVAKMAPDPNGGVRQ